jgi:hypothetical protein
MKRRNRPFIALLALFALAFAQLAVAAHACARMGSLAAPTALVEDSGCCPKPDRSTQCVEHCQFGSASVDSPKPVSVPAVTAGPVLAIVALPDPVPASAAIAHPVWPTAGPPPIRLIALRI